MVLVDPAIYGEGYAYAILYDTGEAAPSAAISELAADAESDWILGRRE